MSRPLPRRGSSFTPLVKQFALSHLQNGVSRKVIAQQMGVSEYKIHVWQCANLPQPEDYVRALDLLKKGANRHAVREAFGGQMPLSNLQILPFKKSKTSKRR